MGRVRASESEHVCEVEFACQPVDNKVTLERRDFTVDRKLVGFWDSLLRQEISVRGIRLLVLIDLV